MSLLQRGGKTYDDKLDDLTLSSRRYGCRPYSRDALGADLVGFVVDNRILRLAWILSGANYAFSVTTRGDLYQRTHSP